MVLWSDATDVVPQCNTWWYSGSETRQENKLTNNFDERRFTVVEKQNKNNMVIGALTG